MSVSAISTKLRDPLVSAAAQGEGCLALAAKRVKSTVISVFEMIAMRMDFSFIETLLATCLVLHFGSEQSIFFSLGAGFFLGAGIAACSRIAKKNVTRMIDNVKTEI